MTIDRDTDEATLAQPVRRVVLSPKGAKVEVEAGHAPVLGAGEVLIQTAFSVVSPGTERSKLELSRKSLVGKARSRPDLVRQTLDKVRQEGLSATMGAVRRKLGESIPLGYSLAGEVLAVGERVEGLKPGDRVAAGGGGYALHADVVVVPQNLVVPVPADVPLDAAAFATIGAVSMHGFRLGRTEVGEVVAVVGLGLIGLLAGAVAKAAGCRVVGIDLRPEALERALAMGFDEAVPAGEDAAGRVLRASRGRGADSVLLCASASTNAPILLAGEIARDRARVVVVGDIPVEGPRDVFFKKELELVVSRSYGPGRYDPAYEEKGRDYPVGYVRWTQRRNLESFVDLVAAGRMDVVSTVTHRFPVDRADEAYATLETTPGAVVLLEYPREERRPMPPPAAPVAPSPRRSVRIGLVGTGSFASRILVPAIAGDAGASVVAVASLQGRPPSIEGARHASTAADVIGDPSIHAVFIATRHDSHAELAAAALAAGKAVFVEKPLALSHEELAAVVAARRDAPGPSMTGFNRRYAPFTARLRDLTASGAPATIQARVNAGPLPPDHWTKDLDVGGGRILGEMCHFVDLVTYLARSAPVSVFAHAAGAASPQGAEDVVATLSFANGSVASVLYAATGDPSTGKERIEVFCGGSTGIVDDWKTLTVATSGKHAEEKGRMDKGHAAEVAAFLTAVRAGGSLADSFTLDVVSTRATLAVVESLATGLPVTLET